MSYNKWPAIISVFAIGVGLGAGLGILFAPQSGEETRDDLRQAARDGVDAVATRGKKLAGQARETVNDAKVAIREVADAAGRAFHEAKNAAS